MTRKMSAGWMVLLVPFAAALWAQNADYQPDPGWQAPPQAVAKQNPLAKSASSGGGRKKAVRTELRGVSWRGGKWPGEEKLRGLTASDRADPERRRVVLEDHERES